MESVERLRIVPRLPKFESRMGIPYRGADLGTIEARIDLLAEDSLRSNPVLATSI
jgi:hypothetical protein